MNITLRDKLLIIKFEKFPDDRYSIIQSWNLTKWDYKEKYLKGWANLELLDKLKSIVKLPDDIEEYRRKLQAVQDAVDRERTNPNPEAFYEYPVRTPLYQHQTRGANMALLTFGWVEPESEVANGKN